MRDSFLLKGFVLVGLLFPKTHPWSFCPTKHSVDRQMATSRASTNNNHDIPKQHSAFSRRQFITSTAAGLAASTALPSIAAVGTLPEFANDNAILQGITIKVADQSQLNSMIQFLENGFECQVLRRRIRGPIEETWMGFGPEQLSIPDEFQPPVSSLASYGGHASIHIVYDKTITNPLYRVGDTTPPGDNIAYLQLGVPEYRISQMVKAGGNILDAYGYVNVISPSGLPIRGIVGLVPDPIMFVAIRCVNVEESRVFYQQLGFVEQEYPFARPSKGMGQFEPPQPAKSVYMAPSANCMGVLLLPMQKRKKQPTINPVVEGLNLVYNPLPDADEDDVPRLVDPSGVSIGFQSVRQFEEVEKVTR